MMKKYQSRGIIMLFLSMMLAGCLKAVPEQNGGNQKNVTMPVSDMRSWIGLTRTQLVAKFGQPNTVLDVTLLGQPTSEAYVYNQDGKVHKCTDAFVIIEESGLIMDYFCR